MDADKLKKWMELAQKVQGGTFWGQIFDDEFVKENMNSNSVFSGFSEMGFDRDKTFPAVDIYESETHIYLVAALPGIQREEVFVSLQGDRLVIKGKITSPFSELKEVQKEMRYGEFERNISLPRLAKDNKLEASFQNGILMIVYEIHGLPEESIPIK
ncbi:Hsp20/alpha crystallin family protein [Neobacillus notoginsengisoli]|uniref:Hsp20/alpha crystallin family protein n=1 Tax=Neobacillus notoginsengisoli TaxID=1578198 RepID=A0A417YPG9_9BACI|nr:Hsp20/alpha crystallin family protein [Neobacillus notoginsengisoli]RHW35724.1 Hsp20/alpha crystallin family protein [Neobacillus notoginsengisoli]